MAATRVQSIVLVHTPAVGTAGRRVQHPGCRRGTCPTWVVGSAGLASPGPNSSRSPVCRSVGGARGAASGTSRPTSRRSGARGRPRPAGRRPRRSRSSRRRSRRRRPSGRLAEDVDLGARRPPRRAVPALAPRRVAEAVRVDAGVGRAELRVAPLEWRTAVRRGACWATQWHAPSRRTGRRSGSPRARCSRMQTRAVRAGRHEHRAGHGLPGGEVRGSTWLGIGLAARPGRRPTQAGGRR